MTPPSSPDLQCHTPEDKIVSSNPFLRLHGTCISKYKPLLSIIFAPVIFVFHNTKESCCQRPKQSKYLAKQAAFFNRRAAFHCYAFA